MPPKKEGDPTAGFEGFLRFLQSPMTESNFYTLTSDALGDDWPRHSMDSGGYGLSRAQAAQRRLRAMLEGVINGSLDHGHSLWLTPEEMLLIRLNALIVKPRRRWLLTISERGTSFKPTSWWKSLQLCPHRARGCQYFYLRRTHGNPRLHCPNKACRAKHDNATRTTRPTSVHVVR